MQVIISKLIKHMNLYSTMTAVSNLASSLAYQRACVRVCVCVCVCARVCVHSTILAQRDTGTRAGRKGSCMLASYLLA